MLEQVSLFRVTYVPHQMFTMLFVMPSLHFDQLVQWISKKLSLMEQLRRRCSVGVGLSHAPDPLLGTAGSWEVCHSSSHHTEALVPREV